MLRKLKLYIMLATLIILCSCSSTQLNFKGEILMEEEGRGELVHYVAMESTRCGCKSWEVEYTYPKAIVTYKNCKRTPKFPENVEREE